MKEEDILVGIDPEFFLFKNGRAVSAHDLVPGTKAEPFPLKDGAVQADGTAVEFNITPARTYREFHSRIENVLAQIRKNIPKEYEFRFYPSVFYDKKYFDEHVPAFSKELGCDPDYSGYSLKPNPRPAPVGPLKYLRTGAGHVHVGWTSGKDVTDRSHMWDCGYIARTMESSTSYFSHYWDNDTERNKLYGNNAAFRPKSYGVEYRALSNAWLRYPKLYKFIFNVAKNTVMTAYDGVYRREPLPHDYKEGVIHG